MGVRRHRVAHMDVLVHGSTHEQGHANVCEHMGVSVQGAFCTWKVCKGVFARGCVALHGDACSCTLECIHVIV